MSELDSARRWMCETNDRLRYKLGLLKNVLRDAQWGNGNECPCCGATRKEGHSDICKIYKALTL